MGDDGRGSGVEETVLMHGAEVSLPVDLDDDILKFAIDAARESLASITTDALWMEKGDAAVANVKAALDKAYAPNWHVVMGRHFSSKVTHDQGRFAFFRIADRSVLVFKS
jgi:dynein light chain LC8-type